MPRPPAPPPPPRTQRDIEGFIDAVADGELDSHIEALAEAVSRRIELLRAAREAILMATLRRGDRVRINHSARPQYLHGEPGTVIDWAGDKVVVRLDQPVGRSVNGGCGAHRPCWSLSGRGRYLNSYLWTRRRCQISGLTPRSTTRTW